MINNEEKEKTFTFELKDLTYDELLDSYTRVNEFLKFLEEEIKNIEETKEKGEKSNEL